MNAETARNVLKKSLFQKCLTCNEKLYSVFDRLWLWQYGHCINCLKISDDILQDRSDKLFKLINEI